MIPETADVIARATEAAFGRPLVVNSLRAVLVEALISGVLPSKWRWCAADWAGWDFEHDDGTRMEVKQSAARQSWAMTPRRAFVPRFDVAERKGFWRDGSEWVRAPGRHAQIYVFAFHPVADDTADHRDPRQWTFYVVPASSLPQAKSIALSRVERLASAVRAAELGDAIEKVRDRLTNAA
jgi:hypothetical protein